LPLHFVYKITTNVFEERWHIFILDFLSYVKDWLDGFEVSYYYLTTLRVLVLTFIIVNNIIASK